jgi:predicted metal-dependent enzyme (double-stranded beta helix superfamily)
MGRRRNAVVEGREMDGQIAARLARLFAEAAAVLARHGVSDEGLREVGGLLRDVAAEPWVREVELAPKHGGMSESRVLRSDGPEGLTLTLARFKAERATGVHDHGSWGVACVVDGRDRYERWQRLDTGEEPGRARVTLVEEHISEPGDVVYWFDRPHDIHNQQGAGGPVRELVLFGRDTSLFARRFFDPDAGGVREALPV